MSKTQRGLSFVLGDSYAEENHILPVNSIQYCQSSRNVFTAGRDGSIKQWTPGSVTETPLNHNASTGSFRFQNEGDLDEQLLKLETSICLSRLTHPETLSNNYSITNSFNIHFDWVNDISLVNKNSGLVSCSSDLSLKYTSLSGEGPVGARGSTDGVYKFQNVHTDYVKKLTFLQHDNKIVSGGLDGKLVIWDLNTLTHIRQFENTSSTTQPTPASSLANSIYSLANNNHGLIGCGGPNNTINLFDIRTPFSSNSSPFIKKLIGHTDNIRCLLMNENFILSGSSDTTVKLWDIRNFKVLQTFEIHDEPVWSLASDESRSDLSTFYSGDRSGVIIKTDLSYLSSNRPSDVYANSYNISNLDDKLGLLTIISKPKSPTPILALCVEEDDRSIWSSTGMYLDRNYIPDTDNLSKYQYLRSCAEYDLNKQTALPDLIIDGTNNELNNEVNDLNSGFYDLVSHLSVETPTLDLQSTLSAVNLNNIITDDSNNNGNIDTNDYNSMFLSINGGPSQEFVNVIPKTENEIIDEGNNKTLVDMSPIEILLNPLHDDQITFVPYNKSPFNSFPITAKSIIGKRLFNNKRQIIVLCLNGDIKIWDIFICKEIKSFLGNFKDGDIKEYLEKRAKDMDDIFHRLQSMDTLNNWCEVEIKAGKLLVIIKESTFDNVKIYYDELIANYPYIAYEHPDNVEGKNNNKVRVIGDDRFFLSRIFLNSIFHKYAIYEWDFDHQLRIDLKEVKPSKKVSKFKSNGGGDTNSISGINENGNGNNDAGGNGGSGSGALKRIKMFGRKSSKGTIPRVHSQLLITTTVTGSNVSTNGGGLPPSPQISVQLSIVDSNFSLGGEVSTDISEFIKFNNDSIIDIENNNPSFRYYDSIMKLIQINKQRYREKYTKNGSKSKTIDSLLSIYSNDPKYELKNRPSTAIDESKLIYDVYKPLINPKRLPNLQFMVLEHSPELGNMRDLCSFHLEDIDKLKYGQLDSAGVELINNLRLFLPKWIGQPILYDFFPAKDGPKIAFQLIEMDYSKVPETKKIGGKTGRKIKKLPIGTEASIKLSSHNMLRVGKILLYLTEKFESRTSEMKDHKLPTDWLELECRDEVLPMNMTLQTIKTKIWKSSSDIILTFRRKYDD